MKQLRYFSFLLALAAIIFSCHRIKDVVTDKADPGFDYAKNGYAKGYVTEVQLDGCTWMIQLEDSAGKKIEPDEIPPGFQKDSLLVWVKYKPDNRMSICMAGQTVNILDIKKR